ncbi:MAG: hypothetical protein ACOYCD_01125 [Kiritimatiellia bacterium]|jgi:hypothetical protein
MHKKHKIFRLLTHAALTGICRSGGSVDTQIRELIRVSGYPPIHVRVADSAVCHQDHLVSPIKSALIGGFFLGVSWRLGGSISLLSLVLLVHLCG